MSVKIKAVVEGDIPSNRLLWLYNSDDGKTLKVGLPKEIGNYVDFLSTRELKDGEQVTVEIQNKNRICTVETATKMVAGANVATDTNGCIGQYTSAPIRIGYALDAGEPGDLIRIVRNPKVYLDKIVDIAEEE